MGLALLKEAFEPIASASLPAPAQTYNDPAEFRVRLSKWVERAEQETRSSRVMFRRQKLQIASVTHNYIADGAPIDEVIENLEQFRSTTNDSISSLLDHIRNYEAAIESENDRIAKFDREAARFLRKKSKRMHELMIENALLREDIVDFITILLANVDPAARGGPEFKNAEDLIADLDD